jgi:transcriptional regulator with XRE-family HTH domain
MVEKGVSNTQKVISEKLRKAREDAGMSQAQVALALKKPQWFVSRSETGTRRVDVGELIRFGKVYNKPLNYFLQEYLD